MHQATEPLQTETQSLTFLCCKSTGIDKLCLAYECSVPCTGPAGAADHDQEPWPWERIITCDSANAKEHHSQVQVSVEFCSYIHLMSVVYRDLKVVTVRPSYEALCRYHVVPCFPMRRSCTHPASICVSIQHSRLPVHQNNKIARQSFQSANARRIYWVGTCFYQGDRHRSLCVQFNQLQNL